MLPQWMCAQDIDPVLLQAKARLDSVQSFEAGLKLSVDISFVNMSPKQATMTYTKGEPTTFSSEDFVLIPKRGLDFSLSEIFEYPFMTVDRGYEVIFGRPCKLLNIIPLDKRADFSIATLGVDTVNYSVMKSEISTKKDGTYEVLLSYGQSNDIIPGRVEVSFEIERIRIPLQYMGKEIEVDKSAMKMEEVKRGRIILDIEPALVELVK